ncbi:CD109 antigen-like [Scaptodrosophila lebanonensis]|uniref:CD109 antigen-like n=1 Tax=Drosophila lebanonensis TaxID=7225 RepID=A0A6J2TP57_DROLE|nr:CD109 antigen-like [Scaptodrosophila lebanonensis]
MILDDNLRPFLLPYTISVELQQNIGVLQAKAHPKTARGVYFGNFDLIKHKDLSGPCRLKAIVRLNGLKISNTVNVYVADYSKPKFHVNIEAPSKVSIRDKIVEIIVRARYFNGKPLEAGRVELRPVLDRLSALAKSSFAVMIKGRATAYLYLEPYRHQLLNSPVKEIKFIVTVDDALTQEHVLVNGRMILHNNTYEIACYGDSLCDVFIAGEETEITFKINHINGTKQTIPNKIVKAVFRYRKKLVVFKSQLNSDSTVSFKIRLPPPQNSDVQLDIDYDGEVQVFKEVNIIQDSSEVQITANVSESAEEGEEHLSKDLDQGIAASRNNSREYHVRIEAPPKISIKDENMEVFVYARYTNGRPVVGKVELQPDLPTDHKKQSSFANLVNGKAKLNLNLKQYAKELEHQQQKRVSFMAIVDNTDTGDQIIEMGSTSLYSYRYKICCVSERGTPCTKFFYPKVNKIAFNITYVNGSKPWDTKKLLRALFEPLDSGMPKKTLKFEGHTNNESILWMKIVLPSQTGHYHLKLIYADEERDFGKVLSEEHHIFKVQMNYPKKMPALALGQKHKITLISEDSFSFLFYHIIGWGKILITKRVELATPTKTYNITITPTIDLVYSGKIYIYYVNAAGKFRSVEQNIVVNTELENKINITAPPKVLPGAKVDLQIRTAPHSFVGLIAVDERVLYPGGGQDLDWRHLLSNKYGLWKMSPHIVTLTNANYTPKYNGTHERFSGRSFIGFRKPRTHHSNDNDDKFHLSLADTLLFVSFENSSSEVFTYTKILPDRATNWILSAFSLHPQKGLGVLGPPTTIRAFRSFFVSADLPDSVMLGEIITVPAVVSNYLPKNLDVQVTLLILDGEFEFVDSSNASIIGENRTQTVNVLSNESEMVSFLLRPRRLGNLTFQLTASSIMAEHKHLKTIKVVAEGVRDFRNLAIFVDLAQNDSIDHTFMVELPRDYVTGSAQIELAVGPNILGPVFENLENLLHVQKSGADHILSVMVSNYLAYNYLQSIKKLSPDIKARIIKNLRNNLNLMLRNYGCRDGGIKLFEESRNCSTWLTAYALRLLSEMSSLVQIDNDLQDAWQKFVLDKQQSGGNFIDRSAVLFDYQNSRLALTADSLLALLAKKKPDPATAMAIKQAISYLNSEVNGEQDALSKVLASYALQKADSTFYVSDRYIRDLIEFLQNKYDTEHWWEVDVKVTSYMLLLILDVWQPRKVSDVVDWLVAQRNSLGGFGSTMDTVLGLQALIKFAEKIGYSEVLWDITVTVHSKDTDQLQNSKIIKQFRNNDLQMQRFKLPQSTASINIYIRGSGASMVQLSYQYNDISIVSDSFQTRDYLCPLNGPNRMLLKVCMDLKNKEILALATLKISIPSGYTIGDHTSEIVNQFNEMPMVVFHILELDKYVTVCRNISLYKMYDVVGQKPVPIVIFDYSDTKRNHVKYYEIESEPSALYDANVCKTKNEQHYNPEPTTEDSESIEN